MFGEDSGIIDHILVFPISTSSLYIYMKNILQITTNGLDQGRVLINSFQLEILHKEHIFFSV